VGLLKPEHLKLLMRPLVRAFLRHAFSIHDFVTLAKTVFVEVAQEEIEQSGEKPNVSRLSAMTGLYRKEVTQIFKKQAPPLYQGASLVARVLSRWETDKRFCSAQGKPRPLEFGSAGSEFSALVMSVSTDTHEGTIFGELKRAGLVIVEDGKAILKKREAYIPGDLDRAMRIIEGNLESCILSGEENVLVNPEPRNLHLRTAYDNVYVDKLPEIRAWILEQGRDLHRRIREFVARHDADEEVSANSERVAGGELVVSSFSWAHPRLPSCPTESLSGP
jgi:hypothetical protein